MRSILLFCFNILLTFSSTIFAQQYDPLLPPNSYQSSQNPNYWKNKMPFPGYWQQDVHYTIDATIDEQTDIVTAKENLVYSNNSPDTLKFVYFHLYQNAFQPESYSDDLQKTNGYPARYGRYESQKLGTAIDKINVDGKEVKIQLDNTILKVWLPKPLLPNENVVFDINFKTYFDMGGNVRRRMKVFPAYGFKHFDGVHWYPRICVYDRKFGWETDQHLGKEFYGDYGTYDVTLNFSDNYVAEATGFLQNRDEVLPKELREKLDIKNFANKPWEEKPSVITQYDPKKRKTWKYHAENVHDFAWTADPTYRIGEVYWNGIQMVSLVQEPHASRWQNAAEYTAKVIETYSKDFGMYVYNKMVVADARDGMEYPMLTLDGGGDPSYRGLLAHEVGHNWFFGMVGNNETYRAALDEGFTQFLTAWSQEKIDGLYPVRGLVKQNYTERYYRPERIRYSSVYMGYLRDGVKEDETTLNTHSDDFGGALSHGGGYGNVYYKTATMLYNLQYVLGDTLFQNAMKNYFNTWKIAHPYLEDFRNSIIHYTKTDLNWFFDQWLETSKTIDYKIGKIRKMKDGQVKITFHRKGEMQMPIDFSVYDLEGKKSDYHIPNNWFEKETKATILPRWIGWGKLKEKYTATINCPTGFSNVIIDTTYRLGDINLMNNAHKTPISVKFDARTYNVSDWKNYEIFARPDVWYNRVDGFKLGFHLNGNYMQTKHIFDFTFWVNSGLRFLTSNTENVFNSYNPISFKGNYRTATNRILKGSSINLSVRYLDGLIASNVGFEFKNRKESTTYYAYFKAMYRSDSTDLGYLMYPNDWNIKKWNNTVNAGLKHLYDYKRGEGGIKLNLRSTAIGSDYDYAQINLSVVNSNYISRFVIKTRFFAQWGTGSDVAPESALYLAGANPEEMMENKYVRSAAFFPQQFNGYGNTTNNFQFGGGLNLRGYNGYLTPFERPDGSIIAAYRGNTGAAGNIEIEFDQLFRIRPKFTRKWLKINTYLFGDVGVINANLPNEKLKFAEPRADAGLGIAATIKKWGPLALEKPLTIRFDMPFLLTRTPNVSPDYVQFRWLIGVNRAF